MSSKPNQKITPTQRTILSMLVFLAVLAIGIFVMLIAGKMVLPA